MSLGGLRLSGRFWGGGGEVEGGGAEGGVYVPTCSVLLYWSLCVIIDSNRSGRIYIRAKEVIGGKANTFLARGSELSISERVLQKSTSSQNAK